MAEPDPFTLEHAALAAWPARDSEDHGGWILRASDGVTKRANSATVLADPGTGRAARIAYCEAFYRDRGLPCIIRLPSFVGMDALDRQLADGGYRFLDPSLVLHRWLAHLPAMSMADGLEAGLLTRDAWLDEFAGLGALSPTSRAGQAGILARIQPPPLFAVLRQRGEVVCAGLGVMHGTRFGIFDVVTRTDRRGRGLASALIAWLLGQARAGDARESYLQVVSANTGAIAVYERLGFRRAYHYWYRIARR